MDVVQFNYPTTIRFGSGAIKELSGVLANAGFKRPLIVTDKSLAALPMIQSISEMLSDMGLIPGVFDGVFGNPVKSQVEDGTKQYHEHGADSIVIIGGGASLDVGKVIALMVNHPGDLFDYEDGKVDTKPVDQPIPFIVAIPTTAGTGSEVGRASVISEDDTGKKRIIFDPGLLPKVVLADPELTFSLPAPITAATGFDALTHNIEAYLAKGYHPMADGIALEGIRLIARHLVTAVKVPNDYSARAGMLMASLMGAVAFQKGLGVAHSCAHALSTHFDTHHGLANALVLKSALEFNRPSCEERLQVIADQIHQVDESRMPKPTVDSLFEWLDNLRTEVGIPGSLKEAGITISVDVVKTAFDDPVHGGNPRTVENEADIQKIFAGA